MAYQSLPMLTNFSLTFDRSLYVFKLNIQCILFLLLVLNDIISTMYNKRYMDEVFKPQELHSKKAMRTVFDRLAHASIMRLNAASMDKVNFLLQLISMFIDIEHE